MHPHCKSTTDDQGIIHKTPNATLVGVIPIIAHHKILAFGNLNRAKITALSNSTPDSMFTVTQLLRGFLSQGWHHDRTVWSHHSQCLRFAIDVNHFIAIFDGIPRDTNHTLDEINPSVVWVFENHHVTPFRLSKLHNRLSENRQPKTIIEFIHQNEITDFQCGKHGSTGDLKRFK